MARRLTAAEKGKGLASDHAEPQVKRIRAPSLDTSALIEDNSLTLIEAYQPTRTEDKDAHYLSPKEMEHTRRCHGFRSRT